MQETTSGREMTARTTRTLLVCGVVAGPVYVVVGAIEAFAREGFDPTRHDLSLLANGEWGWIHIALLVLTGLLTVAGAFGMRRVLRGGRGGTWEPLLVALYGLGLIGAVSWRGVMHFVTGGIGFLGLIGACIVFARRFDALGQRKWTRYSAATGVFSISVRLMNGLPD